jgi:D-serine deaminase-like pyridoxal phosphate-dependent protein
MTAVLGKGPNEALIGVPGSRHALSTPALVLDLDLLDANIASLATHARAHGYVVRPVAKIHKSTEIARRQSEAGANGTCCATLAEAEVMADAGIAGVLLFTSVVTPAKLERLAALNARATGLVVAADDAGNVRQLAEAARRSGKPLEVLVDVEVGGGRTGVDTPEAAVALAREIASSDGLVYAGVQGYNGIPQNTVDFEERRRREVAVLDRLAAYVDALRAADLAPGIITGGGTGSHDIDHEIGLLTECQAGTYIFLDVNYKDAVLRRDDPHPFKPSLSVRTTVISNAQAGFVVTDGGAKELNGLFGPVAPVILAGAPDGATYSLVGDDMGRIDLPAGATMKVGDVVEVMPPHCYQTAIMFSHYHCVRGDDLVEIWPLDAFENG